MVNKWEKEEKTKLVILMTKFRKTNWNATTLFHREFSSPGGVEICPPGGLLHQFITASAICFRDVELETAAEICVMYSTTKMIFVFFKGQMCFV